MKIEKHGFLISFFTIIKFTSVSIVSSFKQIFAQFRILEPFEYWQKLAVFQKFGNSRGMILWPIVNDLYFNPKQAKF